MALRFAPRTVRPRGRRIAPLMVGPITGMRDSLDPTTSDSELATLLENCFPIDADRHAAVIGRPGFRLFGARVGTGTSFGQRSYQLTKLDGTEISLCIIAGEIYQMNWITRTLTKRISTADLTAAGILLNTTGLVYCVTFADAVTISDGTHQPFQWDGTPGGGLTLLTAAHIGGWFGPPVVYYGKQFGIRAAADQRNTIEWSEENQPNVGYETGGFLNVWTLGQTDQEPIFLLVPSNEQLGVFRARSSTAIGGAVTEDFKSTGTREALSDTIGTESPASAVFLADRAYFLDADLRPHVWVPGAGIVPEFGDFIETILGLNYERKAEAVSVYDPLTKRVFLGAVEHSSDSPSMMFGLAPRGKQEASCVIRGFSFTSIDMLKNDRGKPVMVHLTDDGCVYDHGVIYGIPSEQVWNDGFIEGTQPIRHIVRCSYLGFDEYFEKFFTRVDFAFRCETPMTGVVFRGATSHAASTQLVFTVAGGAFSRWDFASWDVDVWGDLAALEHHVALGIKHWGRWFQWTITHQQLDERFGFLRSRTDAYVRGPFPQTP